MADLSIKDNWFSILKKKNLTDDQKNIVEWKDEKWKDMANPDGKKKKGTYKKGRYAPKAVVDSLTPSQRAYENRKKRAGKEKGKQHVPRGKTAKNVYRRVEGRSRGRGFTRRD